jgi:hypothetical protein
MDGNVASEKKKAQVIKNGRKGELVQRAISGSLGLYRYSV